MKDKKLNLPIGVQEKENIFKKLLNNLNSKWLKDKLMTIILVIIIFAIYICVDAFLDKVILPDFDLTKSKVYSLSDETKTKMKNIKNDVKITLINYNENESFINIVEKYTKLNRLIKLDRIDDLASRIDIMKKYSLETTDRLIIVSSGEKEKIIPEENLYTYDYSTYEEIDLTEEAITNAIIDITTEVKPKIYFMTNHIMYSKDYYKTVLETLENEANEVKELDFLTEGSVPEDCNTLIISTIKEDITAGEKDKIIEYINKGGKLLILCGANIEEVELNNFKEILNQYGITIDNGIIFEGTSTNMLSGYPDFIVEKVEANSITKNMNMSMTVCFADATPIYFDESKTEELGVEYETLIKTTETAFKRTNLSINSPSRTALDSEEEEYVVGVLATKKIDDNTSSKIIIYSNELFATDMSINLLGYQNVIVDLYNNRDIAVNSVEYLNEREDIITIRKNYDNISYTVTEAQNKIILLIIFIIPIIIIVIGIIIWQYRKRK